MRVDLSGEPTFAGLVSRIGESMAADVRHADAPLATLAAAAGVPFSSTSPTHGPAPHPLCQAAFALASAHGGEADAANGALRPFRFPPRSVHACVISLSLGVFLRLRELRLMPYSGWCIPCAVFVRVSYIMHGAWNCRDPWRGGSWQLAQMWGL